MGTRLDFCSLIRSLAYEIKTEDIYEDLKPYTKDWFDNSAYPEDHPAYDPFNKKVIGMFKDEYPEGLVHFIGLRSKMYSCIGRDPLTGKRVAKGVKREVIKKFLRHADYERALNNPAVQTARMYRIASSKHQLHTLEQVKISLCGYDDKRFILQDGKTTLAHGHYMCEELRNIPLQVQDNA